MKVVDTNVLLASTFEVHPAHRGARSWLESGLRGNETLALPWVAVVGFLRIATGGRIFAEPMDADAALKRVQSWLSRPQVVCPEPGREHVNRIAGLLGAAGRAGDLVNDAHLAAIALEHGATVVSYDRDFGKFPGLTWRTPDQLLQEGK